MTDEIGPAPDHAYPGVTDLDQEVKQDELRSQALAAEVDTLPQGYYSSWRFLGTFAGTAFNLAGTYFAFEAAAGVISIINEDIGPSTNGYLFSIVWTIAQAISILLFGRNSDQFGRRNIALAANVIGIIGGIVAATAQSMNQLIGANAVLGLAAGIPGSYPLLTGELLSNKGKFLGTMIVVVPNVIATGFGPFLGARLAHLSSWRWIFYIYIILMVIGTALWFVFYHPPSFVQMHGEKHSKRHSLANIDYVGTILLVAGLVLLMLGISWGGTTYPWKSGHVIGLIVSGGVTLVLFVFYEIYRKQRYPIVPMHFWSDVRGFTCVVIISSITGCLQTALFILWPSAVSFIFGSSSTGWEQIGWMSSVVNLGAWAGIMIIGPLYNTVKHLKWQLIVGSAWMTAFLGAGATIAASRKGQSIAVSFLASFPMGWGEIFTMLMVQYIVSESDLGVGFAIVSASRVVLGSIFSSIFVAIYTNKLPGKYESIVVPAVEGAGLPASSVPALLTAAGAGTQDALLAVPGMNSSILQVANDSISEAYSESYAYVFYTAMALGFVCLIAALCLRDFDHYLTDHVSRQIYHREQTKVDILAAKGLQPSSDMDAATTATAGSHEKASTSNHEKAEVSA
ncbi:hypothetical protein Sste5346_002046 [Sporothrix stenoceras]|uniref:Major facilitator superfamily (MFS) profile domain-containing protein n=1 Tax=Sporothrix stenoceras TaxID=5173 RepID=A0ABR3ZJT9_9PEZI